MNIFGTWYLNWTSFFSQAMVLFSILELDMATFIFPFTTDFASLIKTVSIKTNVNDEENLILFYFYKKKAFLTSIYSQSL